MLAAFNHVKNSSFSALQTIYWHGSVLFSWPGDSMSHNKDSEISVQMDKYAVHLHLKCLQSSMYVNSIGKLSVANHISQVARDAICGTNLCIWNQSLSAQLMEPGCCSQKTVSRCVCYRKCREHGSQEPRHHYKKRRKSPV
jgi:hypothetical protein